MEFPMLLLNCEKKRYIRQRLLQICPQLLLILKPLPNQCRRNCGNNRRRDCASSDYGGRCYF